MMNFQTTVLVNITHVSLNVTVTRFLVAKLDFRHSLYKERKSTRVACLPASLVSESNAWIFILLCVRY